MAFAVPKKERDPEQLVFHPEWQKNTTCRKMSASFRFNLARGRHIAATCVARVGLTSLVVCSATLSGRQTAHFAVVHVSMQIEDPTVLIEKDGNPVAQYPSPRKYNANDKWPESIRLLYGEAAMAFAASPQRRASWCAAKFSW